jgi:hypothetical protein
MKQFTCIINADLAIATSACVAIKGKQGLETDLRDTKHPNQEFLIPG